MGNSGVFRVAPGRDGQGLLFELTPGYGGTDSDITAVVGRQLSR